MCIFVIIIFLIIVQGQGMLDMLGFFGLLESPLQELPGVDGESIWAGDEVHLTSKFLERV
jgi:hypothetical protein